MSLPEISVLSVTAFTICGTNFINKLQIFIKKKYRKILSYQNFYSFKNGLLPV